MNIRFIEIVASLIRDGSLSIETELELKLNRKKSESISFCSEYLLFLLHYQALLFIISSICYDHIFSNLTPSTLPFISLLPLHSYRVLPCRLPFLSTLFARFSCQRRLTIHKWLWPLTPLVHLRPQPPE